MKGRTLRLLFQQAITRNVSQKEAIYSGLLGALTAGFFETPGMVNSIISEGRRNASTLISAKPFNAYQFQTAENGNKPIFANAFQAISERNKNKPTVLNSKNGNDIIITDEQFGRKIGKHTKEYGLDPSNAEDRNTMKNIINDIVTNADEVVIGKWKGQDGTVLFYRKGEDLVLVKQSDNNFISIFKGGANNGWFKDMRKQKI